MGSGVSRVVTGSFIGTGSLLSVRQVGFKPSFVQLLNATGLVVAYWSKTMDDDSAFKQINHDTVQNAVITSDGIIPLDDGFSVGTDADLNTAAETVHWVAYE